MSLVQQGQIGQSSHIFIAGSGGMVGSAIKKELWKRGFKNLHTPRRKELDLFELEKINDYFAQNRIDYIINAAAKVGGIQANNTFRADFIHQNLLIQTNLFEAAHKNDINHFLFLGSSCIYPKDSHQPIKECALLESKLEPTNEPYAIAKIAGLKTAEAFSKQYKRNYYSVMPTNLYGERDNFDSNSGHVIASLISKIQYAIDHSKEEIIVWGTGTPLREFLYVDDLAKACVFLIENNFKNMPHWINIGSSQEISIADLVDKLVQLMGFKGKVVFDTTKPDGVLRKKLDTSRMQELGWEARIGLDEGLQKTVLWYRANR